VRPHAALSEALRGDDPVRVSKLRPDELVVTRPGVGVLTPPPKNLQRGDIVQTGSTTSVLLCFADGTRVLVRPDTRVIISSVILERIVNKISEILVDARGRFRAETPLVTAGVEGTRYRLRLESEGWEMLDTAEGTVVLYPKQGGRDPVRVHEGTGAMLQEADSPRLRTLSEEERETLNRAFKSPLFDVQLRPNLW
jgi:hypothetical protein